jgi:RNA polymerase sigma-70 factor (ECF subfamily)
MATGSRGGSRTPIDADEFESLRPYLFSIAYRLLGSASEAEDVLQDAYLRLRSATADDIASPKAYLGTVVTRLSLDRLKSARLARTSYHGPWLPEPVPTVDLAPTPDEAAERREEISLAFLVLLERLTPEERAAYVLREAFGEPYDQIAAMLGKSVAAVRQLAHRARDRIADGRPRFAASRAEQERLTARFLAAAREGDFRALTDALASDVTLWSDGGDKALAARRPIVGRDAVARWLAGILAKLPADGRFSVEQINGGLGVLTWLGSALVSATMLDVAAGRVRGIRVVVNPDKLDYLARRVAVPTVTPGSRSVSFGPAQSSLE